MIVDKRTMGLFVELAGAIAIVAGLVAGVHHLAFSIPVGLGFLAIYVGREIRAGQI
jgi:hypothetical protein